MQGNGVEGLAITYAVIAYSTDLSLYQLYNNLEPADAKFAAARRFAAGAASGRLTPRRQHQALPLTFESELSSIALTS